MAETATDSGKTLGVSKHTWEIIGIAVAGGALLYFGYRWYSNRSSAKTTGSLSGTVTPLAVTGAVGTTGATPTSSGPLTTMDAWINSIISSTSKLTPAVLFNAVNAWQNGTPVTATAYAAISKALRNGIPSWAKGYKLYVTKTTTTTPTGTTGTTAPPPSSGAPGPPPNLPQTLISKMIANGEHIVTTQWDPVTQGWVYLTNKGGIYNEGGGQFFGSIFSLPTHFANWIAPTGRQVRTAAKLTINHTGGYTITDTAGENYTFTTPKGGQDWATGKAT